MPDEWNGVSMTWEDFEAPVWPPATHSHDLTRWLVGRNRLCVRLFALLSATVALGMSACTSEETSTEASTNADPALAAVKRYTAVDLGTLPGCCHGDEDNAAVGINPPARWSPL